MTHQSTPPMTSSPSLWTRLRRWLPLIVFILGLILVVIFGLRAYRQYEYLQKIESGTFAVESLRGWMTMPYIAQLYNVSENELYAALRVPAEGNASLSLQQLISKYNLESQTARQAVEQVILKYRPTPTPS
ncbi:MAG: hypothetical protein HZB52_07480 [Chloroflexi bacterium]|nr:hypothetical protein [Chloroflexota bacterium]